eukprot:1372941-Rhodomonas_salina.1
MECGGEDGAGGGGCSWESEREITSSCWVRVCSSGFASARAHPAKSCQQLEVPGPLILDNHLIIAGVCLSVPVQDPQKRSGVEWRRPVRIRCTRHSDFGPGGVRFPLWGCLCVGVRALAFASERASERKGKKA